MLLRLSLTVLLLTLSCSRASQPASNTSLTSPTAPPAASPTPRQPIRSVDFNNVAFQLYPVYVGDRGKKKYITIKPGDGGPAKLNYGDVTGDGIEETMMMLGIENRGSAIPEIVYIFGLESNKPKMLWSFETGDRADGGLRQVYAQNGTLVVELYGRGKIIGTNLFADDGTRTIQPYPYVITRTRYRWLGTRFQLMGKPEEFSDSTGYGSDIMPYYDGPAK